MSDATPPEPGWTTLFEAAFQQSMNPMVLVDGERRQLDANAAYVALLGYERDQLLGRPLYEFVAGGPLVSSDVWRAVLKEDEFTGEAELVRVDGASVAVAFAGHPALLDGRRLVLFVALRAESQGRKQSNYLEPVAAPGPLSARELDVVRLIALGYSGPEIGDALAVSHNTVRVHARNAMVKLGARTRAHLVAKSLGLGSFTDATTPTA